MMQFIHFLSLIIFFPGIFVLLYNKLFRIDELHNYTFGLITSILLFSVLHMYLLDGVQIVFISVIMIMIYLKKLLKLSYKFFYKTEFVLVIYIPILEELLFRGITYFYFVNLGIDLLGYVIFTSIIFLFSHFYTQGKKILNLIFLSILLAVIYYLFNNLYMIILLHIIYNYIIYISNSQRIKNNIRNQF
jgi:membrane protease YdiL (CAAX protease family)